SMLPELRSAENNSICRQIISVYRQMALPVDSQQVPVDRSEATGSASLVCGDKRVRWSSCVWRPVLRAMGWSWPDGARIVRLLWAGPDAGDGGAAHAADVGHGGAAEVASRLLLALAVCNLVRSRVAVLAIRVCCAWPAEVAKTRWRLAQEEFERRRPASIKGPEVLISGAGMVECSGFYPSEGVEQWRVLISGWGVLSVYPTFFRSFFLR
ncbi:hypothetical protein Taro_003399, partial [Colocasia esculenta]|nr:hypothetical protein [Colocasia esculenta]